VNTTIPVPRIRDIVRHATPNIIEGRLVPLVLFVAFLEAAGTMWALLTALAYSLVAIAYRAWSGRRVPGLIVLSAVALVARTVAAIVTGSMVVYLLQPTISTLLLGISFLASVRFGRPLAQRLADDVFPMDDATRGHPLVQGFFVRLSLLWSVTCLVNAVVTIWLLLTQSTTTFVLVKTLMGPPTALVAIGLAFAWFRRNAARSGTHLVRWCEAAAV
jgi:intracellular septation protein A